MHLLDRHLRPRLETARSLGHIESWFAKLCDPGGRRAVWLKHTLLVPREGPPHSASWLVRFDERKEAGPPRGIRSLHPLEEVEFADGPFRLQGPESRLERMSEELRWSGCPSRSPGARWDVVIAPLAPPVRLLPARWMYEASFPRSKTLTPVPDGLARGWVELGNERWRVDGWRVLFGHNWGAAHAERYLWIACNLDLPEGRSLLLEAAVARVRTSLVTLPWLATARVELAGEAHSFNSIQAVCTPRVVIEPEAVRLLLHDGAQRLELRARFDRSRLARLPYEDPDGRRLWCLNTKLAQGEIRWHRAGRPMLEAPLSPLAVEIGIRKEPHGVPVTV